MGVSVNSGTPKSSILIGFSIINHPFWGTFIFGNPNVHPYLGKIPILGFRDPIWRTYFSSGLVKNHQVDARSTSDSANGQFFSTFGDDLFSIGKLWLKFKFLFHGPLAEEEHFLGGLPDYLIFTSNLGCKSARFPLNRMNRGSLWYIVHGFGDSSGFRKWRAYQVQRLASCLTIFGFDLILYQLTSQVWPVIEVSVVTL